MNKKCKKKDINFFQYIFVDHADPDTNSSDEEAIGGDMNG